MRSIHTVEGYSATQRNKVLTQATTLMELENLMLNERKQTLKITYCVTPLTGNVWTKQIHKDRKELSGCQAGRQERNGQ